jgi:hypothetical protein
MGFDFWGWNQLPFRPHKPSSLTEIPRLAHYREIVCDLTIFWCCALILSFFPFPPSSFIMSKPPYQGLVLQRNHHGGDAQSRYGARLTGHVPALDANP